jgi:hypothetical protein
VCLYRSPFTREIWIGADGSGRLRQADGDAVFFSDAGRDSCGLDGAGAGSSTDRTVGPDGLGVEHVDSLPTDTAALRKVVEGRASQSKRQVDAEMFVVVGDLLRETAAAPRVRAALYRVAATIGGIEFLGDMTDHAGRAGVGVAHTEDGVREILVFDPATSQFLEERQVSLVAVDGAPGPIELGYSTYLASGIVPAIGDVPAR